MKELGDKAAQTRGELAPARDGAAPAPRIEPSPGQMVTSTLRLVRPLGAGGMGSVWVADHLALHTEVVVKFMSADLVKSPEAVTRFAREAAAASQVKSPHVVQTLDHGVLEGLGPYIVMELLEGHDLAHHLEARGKLPPLEVVAIVAQLARALGKAHRAGIVHRDIKPNNVFLCDAGGGELFVKLLDFGIAKAADLGSGGALVGSTTRTGSFVGSPFYMSPEQVIGAKTIDFRTDLWSLGVVAFEALTGDKPFFAETVGGLALKIHRDPLPVPSHLCATLPPSVDAWFARACARDAAERFQSAKEMADAFAVAVTGERLTPGVSSDSGPRAPGISAFASTAPASALQSARTEVDVKSQTDSGVGLASEPASTPRGRMLAAFVIGVAVVAIGFGVPRIMRTGAAPDPSVAGSTSATAVAPAPSSAPAPSPAFAPSLTLASALAPSPAPSASAPCFEVT